MGASIVESRQTNVAIWKSSALAALFHGLDAETTVNLGQAGLTSEMEQMTKRVFVRLKETDGGVKVKQQLPGIQAQFNEHVIGTVEY